MVKVIIWDFDGTIFKSKELGEAYEIKYFEYSKKYSIKRSLTLANFRSATSKYGSWKEAASIITGQSPSSITNWVDDKINKADFVKPDEDIVKLICGLKNHKHIILSNARGNEIVKGLRKIGFKKQGGKIAPFIKILSRDDGVNKPDLSSFKKVSKITALPGNKHLMIGDSSRDDILPAKEYGFFAVHIDEALEILPRCIKK